jgi:tetratricopeptide (TPR) repeat protein
MQPANPQADLPRLERSPRDIERWKKAQQQLMAGRAAAALPAYRELTQRFPGILNLWFELGTAAAGDLDFAQAGQAFECAESLASSNPNVLVMIGQQYHRLRQPARARACYQRAIEADPSSIHARLSWAAWLERERRLTEASEQVDACLTRQPKDPSALYYRAFLTHRAGRPAEAEKLLRDLTGGTLADPNVRASCFHLLGLVLDELGQYAEAMEWLLKAKALIRQSGNVAAMEKTCDQAARHRRSLLAALTPEMIRRWRVDAKPGSGQLALLGGHPRSGTTLLEQILAAHPSVRAFDESEAFVGEVGDKLAPLSATVPLSAGALNALPAALLDEMRRRYFKSLFREGANEPPAAVLLDKNPGSTSSVHLWLRVFPESKILIALRDPRDVVLSCFFQNLALTPVNANFLSLDRAVKHYEGVMDTWLRLRELGGFAWLETRYEDVARALETEGRRITEFLGLTWHAGQAASHEAARGKLVYSPTYGEVAQPVHDRAVGRWRNYAAALDPWLPRLNAFAKTFGYAD